MVEPRTGGRGRLLMLTIEIKLILLAVQGPTLLEFSYLFRLSDSKSSKRKDQCPN